MACFRPLPAFKTRAGDVVFRETADCVQSLFLPCGQCIGCRLERSRQWAMRCMSEAQLHDVNSFVTLTYSPENLPKGGSLYYRDFQLFMKRLRKARNERVRFYMCGEYGEQLGRPHFHACLFGVDFRDKSYLSGRDGVRLFTSNELDNLWCNRGYASVGEVTFESAAYVARYCVSKVTGKMAELYYRRVDNDTGEVFSLVPEFNRMSLKPGIGADWYRRFRSDVYPSGKMVVRGKLVSPPRYFDKLYARDKPDEAEWLQFEREMESRLHSGDRTDERLAVREKVSEARVAQYKRNNL